jgi:CHASE3 domain sensor protein
VVASPRAERPVVPSGEPGSPPRSDAVRRWSLRRWVAVISVISLLVTAGAITAGALALRQLSGARTELVDGLDPALLSAQKLSVGLVDEETGVRGYAISGVPAFLEPYLTGHQQEIEAIGELRSLGRPVAGDAWTCG